MDIYEVNTPEYTVELWDINGVYVMDISELVATSLRIQMEVNKEEDIQFSLDLVQFELKCAAVGANPRSILEPYRTDVKIRRNGNYLCGGQVVQANTNFNQGDTNKIEVKCTGYLNYFKDRYITERYEDMTYAQIARQLISDTQSVPNLISNARFFEDVGGWYAVDSGYIAWDENEGHVHKGCLYVSNTTGTLTYGGARWTEALLEGVTYTATFWAKATTSGGTIYVSTIAGARISETAIPDTNWNEYTISWVQGADSTFFDIKTDGSVNFFLDDVELISSLDEPIYFNFGVTLGIDAASETQGDDRIRTYDIQNVKDAIVNLTSLENDNFDFEFTANKVFNVYQRLGSDKPDYELVYPQNITSISVTRDASTLANRIIGLGSGIGTERLESIPTSYESAAAYRVRERTETFNSVQIQSTLEENTFGKLKTYQDIYEVPTLNVEANNLDLDNIHLGDSINVRIDGSSFVTTIDGMYRIMSLSINLDKDYNEQINVDLLRW